TLQTKEMAVYAHDRGLELEFLRLWVPWCHLHQVLPALSAAIEAGPDVVMLDSWTLAYDVDRRTANAYRRFEAEPPADLAGNLRKIVDDASWVREHQAFLFDRLTWSTEGQMKLPVDTEQKPKRRIQVEPQCNANSRRRMLRQEEGRFPAD